MPKRPSTRAAATSTRRGRSTCRCCALRTTPDAVFLTTELTAAATASLLSCAPADGWSATVMITSAGRRFEHGGVRIDVPAGAVLTPTRFAVTVPASTYAEIQVTADGATHYRFAAPVTMTIPYDHCGLVDTSNLGVWYIDKQSRALLEFMGGHTDPVARTVTFQTDHLSGYAIAD
jgi:hypothetical protein